MNTREYIVEIFLQNPDYTQKKIAETVRVSLSIVKKKDQELQIEPYSY